MIEQFSVHSQKRCEGEKRQTRIIFRLWKRSTRENKILWAPIVRHHYAVDGAGGEEKSESQMVVMTITCELRNARASNKVARFITENCHRDRSRMLVLTLPPCPITRKCSAFTWKNRTLQHISPRRWREFCFLLFGMENQWGRMQTTMFEASNWRHNTTKSTQFMEKRKK